MRLILSSLMGAFGKNMWGKKMGPAELGRSHFFAHHLFARGPSDAQRSLAL